VATRTVAGSAQFRARAAGVFYLITFVAGTVALLVRSSVGFAAGLVAAASYVAVTILFYYIFKPVSRSLSLLAAVVSFVGCGIGPLVLALKLPVPANNLSLVFFGLYCLLIGYLILRSTFLPRFLGTLMLFAALGWLTFASPALAAGLYPYNFIPGMLGEGALTVWLLLLGVDADKWTAQAYGQLRAP
jgi:hypothetical protein